MDGRGDIGMNYRTWDLCWFYNQAAIQVLDDLDSD